GAGEPAGQERDGPRGDDRDAPNHRGQGGQRRDDTRHRLDRLRVLLDGRQGAVEVEEEPAVASPRGGQRDRLGDRDGQRRTAGTTGLVGSSLAGLVTGPWPG